MPQFGTCPRCGYDGRLGCHRDCDRGKVFHRMVIAAFNELARAVERRMADDRRKRAWLDHAPFNWLQRAYAGVRGRG